MKDLDSALQLDPIRFFDRYGSGKPSAADHNSNVEKGVVVVADGDVSVAADAAETLARHGYDVGVCVA